MKKAFLLTVCGLLLTGAAWSFTAKGEEHIVTQENLTFSTPFELVKPGDVIVFKNNDTTAHNIVSLTEPHQFNVGTFQPGMVRSVTFNKPGVVDVECSIHPDMKMTVFVWAHNH